jgi:hypothetical protein
MSFINKKQNVVDISLTFYGRSLLAKGIISFDFFKTTDNDVIYSSSSNDYSIEALPILESLSDDVDVHMNQLFSNNMFSSKYSRISLQSTSSVEIKRQTDESFETDPVLLFALSPPEDLIKSPIPVSSRVEALKRRGAVSDTSSSIYFNRSNDDNNPKYLVFVEISSSIISQKLLSSGSSFGISDDNNQLLNKSNEINEADTFFELVKII